jgi:hypothetical protein
LRPEGEGVTDGERRLLKPGDRVVLRGDDGREGEYVVKHAPWQLGHGEWVIGLFGLTGGWLLGRIVRQLPPAQNPGRTGASDYRAAVDRFRELQKQLAAATRARFPVGRRCVYLPTGGPCAVDAHCAEPDYVGVRFDRSARTEVVPVEKLSWLPDTTAEGGRL